MQEITIEAQGMNVYGGRAWTVHPDGSVEFHELDIYDQRDIDAVREAERGPFIHGDCVRHGCAKAKP